MNTFLKRFKYHFVMPIFIAVSRRFISSKTSDKEGQDCFFVLGSGRNGSTLMATILNRHSKLALPPEQYALPYTIYSYHIKFWKSWISYFFWGVHYYANNNNNWNLQRSQLERIETDLKLVSKRNRNPMTLYKAMCLGYLNLIGNEDTSLMIGDHSPVTTLHFKNIYYSFKRSKQIFMVRHPFDVMLSYEKLTGSSLNEPDYIVYKWNYSIKVYKWLIAKNADVLLVKYEDLVRDPEGISLHVLEFLGIDSKNLIQGYDKNQAISDLGVNNLSFHENLRKPINSDSVGKWKTSLNEDLVKKYKERLKRNATYLGYDLNK